MDSLLKYYHDAILEKEEENAELFRIILDLHHYIILPTFAKDETLLEEAWKLIYSTKERGDIDDEGETSTCERLEKSTDRQVECDDIHGVSKE